MKIAKVYIIGQIGNSYNEDGSLSAKGVELQDVVEQVAAVKDAEGYEVTITSLGGSVRIGKLIAAYLKSLTNCFTIAKMECASMGTEIHLAVPLANRKIVKGTAYSIHNPLMANITGNASELVEYAEMIKESEKDMLKMYVSATGLTKEAVAGLMNQETSLTAEQCLSMGFVSEVLPATSLKAIAFFDKPNSNNITMKEMKEMFTAAFGDFRKNLKLGKSQADLDAEKAAAEAAAAGVDYTCAEGVLHLDSAEVGSMATLDGKPAPAADYTTEDGTVITIDAESKVSGIENAEEENTEMAALQLKNAALEAQIVTMSADFEKQLTENLNALKADIGSSYVPKDAKAIFTPKSRIQKDIVVESVERKKTYRQHKA